MSSSADTTPPSSVPDLKARILEDPEDYLGNRFHTDHLCLGMLVSSYPNLDSDHFHGLLVWYGKVTDDIMVEIRNAKRAL